VDRKQNANKFFQVATPNYICYRINTQVAILLSDTKPDACLAIFVVSFDVFGFDLPIALLHISKRISFKLK